MFLSFWKCSASAWLLLMLVFGLLGRQISHGVFGYALDLNWVHWVTYLFWWVHIVVLLLYYVHILSIYLFWNIGYALEVTSIVHLIVVTLVLWIIIWVVLLTEAPLWHNLTISSKLRSTRTKPSLNFCHLVDGLNLILQRVITELLLMVVWNQLSLTRWHDIRSISWVRFDLHLFVRA